MNATDCLKRRTDSGGPRKFYAVNMKCLVVCVSVFVLSGCNSPTQPAQSPPPPVVSKKLQTDGGGIAPMATPEAGGLTPVANSDSVEGAGMGGVGQSAKVQARKAAEESNTTQGSTDQEN
jgi:hypothetical protein